jgi:hypothetical protein
MLPPVFQCRNGHPICAACEPQLNPARCPTCKEAMPVERAPPPRGQRGGPRDRTAPLENGSGDGKIRALALEQMVRVALFLSFVRSFVRSFFISSILLSRRPQSALGAAVISSAARRNCATRNGGARADVRPPPPPHEIRNGQPVWSQ